MTTAWIARDRRCLMKVGNVMAHRHWHGYTSWRWEDSESENAGEMAARRMREKSCFEVMSISLLELRLWSREATGC